MFISSVHISESHMGRSLSDTSGRTSDSSARYLGCQWCLPSGAPAFNRHPSRSLQFSCPSNCWTIDWLGSYPPLANIKARQAEFLESTLPGIFCHPERNPLSTSGKLQSSRSLIHRFIYAIHPIVN